jgi:hypothetical protein
MDVLNFTNSSWRGVPAWRITGASLELVITQIGGHLAAIRYIGEDLNPLWQPTWHAADPDQVRQGGYYGGIEAGLLAAIVGHNVCIDRFGPAHAGEQRPVHGEAGVSRWSVSQPRPDLLEFTVPMPLAGLTARKHVQLAGDCLHLTHAVHNPGKEHREIEWCEHINCGQPFIDYASCEAGIDKIFNWHGEPEPNPRFPQVPSLGEMPIAEILEIPTPESQVCGDVVAGRVKTAAWSITNASWKRRLSCEWTVSDFPWLTIWTQHRSRPGTPWFNRERTRGMELTTKPYPNGRTDAEVYPSFQGVTTLCQVEPGQWKAHPIRLRWERI